MTRDARLVKTPLGCSAAFYRAFSLIRQLWLNDWHPARRTAHAGVVAPDSGGFGHSSEPGSWSRCMRSLFSTLQKALSAVVEGWLQSFSDEALDSYHAVGALFILPGIYLASRFAQRQI